MSRKRDSFPNVVTPQKYMGLKNPDSGNRLYSFHLLVGLIGKLLCPECKDGPLVLHEHPIGIGVVGFHSKLQIKCVTCNKYVATTNTSDTLSSRASITNIRAVAAGRNAGIGYSQLVKFFAGLNVPPPMHIKTFTNAAAHVKQIISGIFSIVLQFIMSIYLILL